MSKGLLNPDGIACMESVSFSTQATMNSMHADLSEYSANEPSFTEEIFAFNPNPNKGVLTIDVRTTQIVITNTIVCNMLGYSNAELIQMKLGELVLKEKPDQTLPDMLFKENGDIVVFNGKVVRNNHQFKTQ